MAEENLRKKVSQAINFCREVKGEIASIKSDLASLKEGSQRPLSVQDDINRIEGRRIAFGFTGRQRFSASQEGKRGDPLKFQVSTSGPFIQTHWPVVAWRPVEPDGATNLYKWSPVVSSPLQEQHIGDIDIIDLQWELADQGASRNFQNEAVPPMFSSWYSPAPLPEWTMYEPNATITFTPLYERIGFNQDVATPTTRGELVVMLPGFKIVSM